MINIYYTHNIKWPGTYFDEINMGRWGKVYVHFYRFEFLFCEEIFHLGVSFNLGT